MSKIEISNDTRIIRHRTPARFSHWLLVICFFMTMFTGVAFFFPDFAWLTEILGTPQLARAIHPFTGIIMFVAFIFLGYLYWDHNIPEKNDIRWLKGIVEVLKGNELSLIHIFFDRTLFYIDKTKLKPIALSQNKYWLFLGEQSR